MNIADIQTKLLSGNLKVRYHSGVGFMQAYLTNDIRLHVWHPDLPGELEAFGNRHDHRFDLKSNILLGGVVDTQFETVSGMGLFDIYTVKPAHFEDPAIPELQSTMNNFGILSIMKHKEGDFYHMPSGVFHESRAEGLTVTVMRKSNQVEAWARILATPDQEPEHAMAYKPSQTLLDQLFFSALRKLGSDANDTIEQLTLAFP